jgi:CubicO group peptidase (beta-lactamase class C family)
LGARIDSIVTTAIDRKATPGAVVLVAKNGKVIFHKAYGKHTYEGNQKVALTDLYDLASVTKISTSVAAMMRMSDEGKFSLSSTMGDMIPDWKNSNKAGLVYKDILTHQARLRAWIPFWQDCIDSTKMLLASKVYQDKIAAHGYPEGYKITFWEKFSVVKKLMLVSKKQYSLTKNFGLNV